MDDKRSGIREFSHEIFTMAAPKFLHNNNEYNKIGFQIKKSADGSGYVKTQNKNIVTYSTIESGRPCHIEVTMYKLYLRMNM